MKKSRMEAIRAQILATVPDAEFIKFDYDFGLAVSNKDWPPTIICDPSYGYEADDKEVARIVDTLRSRGPCPDDIRKSHQDLVLSDVRAALKHAVGGVMARYQ